MKLSAISEAIADYTLRTGEEVDLTSYTIHQAGCLFNPTTNKYLKVLPSNEWCIFAIGEREGLSYLHLDQTYGYMKNLAPFLLEIMRIANLEIVTTSTRRNHNVFIRKWKMEHIPEYDFEIDNVHYYTLIGDTNSLKQSLKWEV